MTVRVNMETDSSQVESAIARLARKFKAAEAEAKRVGDTASKINLGKKLKVDPAISELKQVNTTLLQTQRTFDTAMTSISSSMKRAALSLGAIFASGVIGKSLISAADSVTLLENKLANVVKRGPELNKVMQELYNLSRETGSSVSGSADVFSKFAKSMKDAKKSTTELVGVTKTVQQAIAISGSSAASAEAAIMQLGQGLASGTLRGEELNSVLEQAPRLAQAIADEMGIAYGQLRIVAADGAITSDIVYNALVNQANTIDKEFANTTRTTGQRMVNLKDVVVKQLAEIDKAMGTSARFGGLLSDLTDRLTNVSPDTIKGFYYIANYFSTTFKYAIVDTITVLGGIANVITAIFKRAGAALPYITLPLTTVWQDVSVAVDYYLARIYLSVLKFSRSVLLAFAGPAGSQIERAISNIFNADSVAEVRAALDDLAYQISVEGRRWYNITGNIARGYYYIRNEIFNLAIALDIMDERLIAFRRSSLDGFGTILDILRRIGSAFATQVSIDPFLAHIIAGFSLIKKVAYNLKESVVLVFKLLWKEITIQTRSAFGKVTEYIVAQLERIERGFYWLYDKVVGNSWWPDMLLAIQSWTDRILPSVAAKFTSFKAKVESVFKSLFEKTAGMDVKVKIGLAKDSIGQAKEFVVGLAKLGADAASAIWQSIASLSPEIAAVISTGIISGILAAVHPDSFKALNKFFTIGFIAAIGAAFSDFGGEALLDSNFFTSFGRGLGATAGTIVKTIIDNIPNMIAAVIQVAEAFGAAFLDQLGIIGSAIKGLATITGTSGILNTLIFGTSAAFIFGKLETVKKVFFGMLTLFSGKALGGVGVGKDGKQEGLLGSLLLGRGRGVLAGIAAVYTALQFLPNLFSGNLSSIAGGVGMVSLLLFGAGGTASLIIDSIKQIANSFGLFKGGKSLLNTAGLKTDIKDIKTAFESLRGSTTFEGLKSSFVALGLLIKRAATSIYTDLSPAFSNLAVKARASMAGVNAAVSTGLAGISAKASAVGGEMGVVGAGLFGKFAKTAGIIAAFTLLFTGISNAATEEFSAASVASSALDLGMVGAMLFGAAGSNKLLSMVGSLSKGIGSKLFSGLGTAVSSFGSFMMRAILSPIGNALKSAGALILRFASGIPGLLVTAAVGGGGFLLKWLFGEESEVEKRLAALRQKAVGLRDQMEDLFSEESITGLLAETDFKIDLNAILDDSNLEGMSEAQLKNVNVALATFRTVAERNNDILTSEGQLTRSNIKEVERAARDIVAAVKAGPDPLAEASQVSDLRGSIISMIKDNQTDNLGAVFSQAEKAAYGSYGAVAGKLPPEFQMLTQILDVFDEVDLTRIDPKVAAEFSQQVNQYLASLDTISSTFVLPSTREMETARINNALIPQLEKTMNSIGLSFSDAVKAADLSKKVGEIMDAATTLGLKDITEDKLKLLDPESFEKLRTALLDATLRGVKAPTGKFGDKDAEGTITELPTKFTLEELNRLQVLSDDIIRNAAVKATETITGSLALLNQRLQEAGAGFELQSPVDTASFAEAQRLLGELQAKQEELAKLDFTEGFKLPQLQADIENLKGQLLETLGTTEQKVEAMLSMIEGAPSLDSVLSLSPDTINKALALSRILANIMAILQGGGLYADASVGNAFTKFAKKTYNKAVSLGLRAAAGATKLALNDVLGAGGGTGEGKGSGKGKGGGGGGGGGGGKEAAKTWWEEFQSGIKDLDLKVDSDILAGLQVGTIDKLTAMSGKYKAAQEALNNSTKNEVELRRKSLELMQKARQEAIAALNDGTVGGATAALESAGVKFDEGMIGRLNAASVAYATQLALRIDQLTLERNTMALGSTAAVQATNAISAMKLELEAMTNSSQVMRDAFNSGLQSFLKGQSTFKEFVDSLLDTFTNTIIEKFSTSFTDALFNSLGLDNLFGKLFGGASKLGSGLGGGLGKGLQPGSTPANPLWVTSKDNLLGGLAGGGKSGGGGGGILGWVLGLLGLGFAEGGHVNGPGTGTSDSILARLSDGEFVVNAKSTKQWLPVLEQINNNGKMPAFATGGLVGPANNKLFKSAVGSSRSQQVFHINVTGDVSNQTRKEVLTMLPEISAGVNMVNRERGSR